MWYSIKKKVEANVCSSRPLAGIARRHRVDTYETNHPVRARQKPSLGTVRRFRMLSIKMQLTKAKRIKAP